MFLFKLLVLIFLVCIAKAIIGEPPEITNEEFLGIFFLLLFDTIIEHIGKDKND
jgi:membrane protein CcdC involved in cytochrome C biogenesis